MGEVFWSQSSSPEEVRGHEARVEGEMDGDVERGEGGGDHQTGTGVLGSDCYSKSALMAVGGSLSFDYCKSRVLLQCKRKTGSDC